MEKFLLYTLYGNNNIGNKLQNYATQMIFNQSEIKTLTVPLNYNTNFINSLIDNIKEFIKKIINYTGIGYIRNKKIREFDKNITKAKKKDIIFVKNIIIGSDQTFNPLDVESNKIINRINNLNSKKLISFSSSMALKENNFTKKYIKALKKIDFLSVREEAAKKVIEELTERKDIEVLLDPTMLIDTIEWDKISKKPALFDKLCKKDEKYILNYFLGNLEEKRKNEIEKIAKKHNCKIINILDKNDPFYICGPSEFLWLEKNAFLICTDSFHSSVFAILYNKPFIVFNRDDGQFGTNNMNSRLETLLTTFKLNDRYCQNEITTDLLKCDYTHIDKILKQERKKAKEFLIRALDMKNGD